MPFFVELGATDRVILAPREWVEGCGLSGEALIAVGAGRRYNLGARDLGVTWRQLRCVHERIPPWFNPVR